MKAFVEWTFAALLVASPLASQAGHAPPAAPPHNPYLADSEYPVAHGYGDLAPYAGPRGPSRVLRDDEIEWKPVGPINGFVTMYSSPYANGKRVIWVGGYDRIAKLDADTLAVLTTYAIGGNTYFGEEEIMRHIATMDGLDEPALEAYEQKLWREPFKSVQSACRMVSRDNELYVPHRSREGVALRVYGETDPSDPGSEIILKREWKIPPEITRANIMSVNMTYDGHVVMATQDGVMIALSRDFSKVETLKLPRKGEEPVEANFFAAFVRNGLTVDDRNGIYLVTRDNMHRVQWTGSKLSLDPADGAWSAPYPNEVGIGSGTTPTPMGWGPNEDHLVVIADGAKNNHALFFWRDQIPVNWRGLRGFDRRVAGETRVDFGVAPEVTIQVENAPLVQGYGAFFNNFDNSYLAHLLPKKRSGGVTEQEDPSGYVHRAGARAPGGSRIEWDPKSRAARTVWRSQLNFANTVCTISSGSSMVYCWGKRADQWTLEGVDWVSGTSAFHYSLGKSKRYDALGGPIILGPNGEVNCGCSGGLGFVRITAHDK
jgi:hypothetical protein